MLEKIENFYLLCLRIVVLLAATVALAVFVWACSQGLPFVTSQLGLSQAGDTPSPSLSTYIAEQQPVLSSGADQTTISSSGPPGAPSKVTEAARLLGHYITSRHIGTVEGSLVTVLMNRRSDVPETVRSAYDDNLLAVMQQLDASRGTPLTFERINALLDWQKSKFIELAEAQGERKELAATKATASLAIGAAALGAFLLIIFFFIFVKIERNLRLVRTVEVASS